MNIIQVGKVLLVVTGFANSCHLNEAFVARRSGEMLTQDSTDSIVSMKDHKF